MAVTVIKSYNSDNQAIVNSDGELLVSGTFTGGNDSVAPIGGPIPADATLVGGEDPSGDFKALQTTSTGILKVTSLSEFVSQVVKVLFNEVMAIPVGIETLVNTYTAPAAPTISYLLTIQASGENRGQYNVYLDGSLLDKKYSNVTQLEAGFDYKTGASSVPGMIVPSGQTLEIKVVNDGNSSAAYNGRYLILEAVV